MKKLIFTILLMVGIVSAKAQLTIEAASSDPTLIVRGVEHKIGLVNSAQWSGADNYIALFTDKFGKAIQSPKRNLVAVVVDSRMSVVEVVNGAGANRERPAFDNALNIAIPQGGFVLIASDEDYSTKGFKRFLAENFRVGDVIKVRNEGEVITLAQLAKLASGDSGIELSLEQMQTVLTAKQTISGSITNYNSAKNYKVEVVEEGSGKRTALKIDKAKGTFAANVTLNKGVNYLDVVLSEGTRELACSSLIFFLKDKNQAKSEIVLWVEQFPNAKVLTNDGAVEAMVAKAVEAGFTSIGFDVKGPEGYVSYRKATLSKTPYFTATKNPNKKIEETGFDLLESILKYAHAAKLKVFVSFNFFTEGNITAQDYAVLDNHPGWEEIVQQPADKGQLLPIRQSARGREAIAGKITALAFTNPSNREVQDFQLLRVEEVLMNYPIDGVVLDRCRYDNLYADFSELTRGEFQKYLEAQGKKLEAFPADAFRIDEQGEMVRGQYYVEWITFRSMTIRDFTDRVRALVDRYKREKNPELKLAAYVGSWYEVYYQNGVNWASDSFRYNKRLNFPEEAVYTLDYYKTSYIHNLDFLMIGTYYKTGKEVNKYITQGNILTGGKLPILGSMSLPDLKVEQQGEVFAASVKNSAGLMIFDLCYIEWASFLEQMRRAGITK